MNESGIHLRRATDEDAIAVWELANDPLVRAMSFLSKPIPWDEHIIWYRRQLHGEDTVFFVIENGNQEFLGNVRFALEGSTARISISLAAPARGGGLAGKVIGMACSQLFEGGQVDCVEAFIRPENAASIRSFLKAGFTPSHETLAHGEPALRFVLQRTD